MSFSCQKGEFDRFFNRLGRPVEESRPDRFPSLPWTLAKSAIAIKRILIHQTYLHKSCCNFQREDLSEIELKF